MDFWNGLPCCSTKHRGLTAYDDHTQINAIKCPTRHLIFFFLQWCLFKRISCCWVVMYALNLVFFRFFYIWNMSMNLFKDELAQWCPFTIIIIIKKNDTLQTY